MSESDVTVDVKSPCISVCALDDDGVCIGCWRTVDEIASWTALDNDRRREVVRLAQQRAREAGQWM
jgi:predicted Fe-S protein YdhL (DUF1289 family)